MFFFFFQAEDGIRDLTVTGVQTCALPISSNSVNFTVNANTGTFTLGGSAVTGTAGASVMSTITVTPSGGVFCNVDVTFPPAGFPPRVTGSPRPLAVNVTGATAGARPPAPA